MLEQPSFEGDNQKGAVRLPRLAFTVEELAEVMRISRRALYRAIKEGTLESFAPNIRKDGTATRRLISYEAAIRFIREREAETRNKRSG